MSRGVTLVVDGSTYTGSAAVIRDAVVIAASQLEGSAGAARTREESFLPMVANCLDEAGVAPAELARIVCGSGPGSFTSLRVAASIAKGIAVGAGCPLFAVSSLMLMVPEEASGRYLAVMPAMRGEVFAGLFEADGTGGVIESAPPKLLAEGDVEHEAARLGARVAIDPPHARRAALLLGSITGGGVCDIDTWEPTYGRLAEAQVRWEAAHGRPLTAAG